MKTNLLFISKIFLCSILFLNCNKEASELSQNQRERNAINEIRNIVGTNSIITPIDNKSYQYQSNFSSDSSFQSLSISQLKEVYFSLKDKSKIKFATLKMITRSDINIETSTFGIKSYDDVNDPLKPSLYKAIFKGPTSLYSTSITFYIGNNGEVLGTPAVNISPNYYYDPYSFKVIGWSAITFNSVNSRSQFSIIGSLSMNVGVGGMSFNIISKDIIFDFFVNSNEGIVGLK
jgi:hypothetical protein